MIWGTGVPTIFDTSGNLHILWKLGETPTLPFFDEAWWSTWWWTLALEGSNFWQPNRICKNCELIICCKSNEGAVNLTWIIKVYKMKNLICGARGWDPAVQEEKEEKDEEEKATLIKSRDPPLAGGKHIPLISHNSPWYPHMLIDWLPDRQIDIPSSYLTQL